jgi:acetylornithine deacetylase/succinyl-diaminopimelate desuccinylase-like protein
MNETVRFIESSQARYVDELSEFLAFPSISALPQHVADMRRCAEWTAAAMARIGLQNVRVMETAGHPIVYGEWLQAAEAPTILCYGHYDVQPVDPLDMWISPPFEPTLRDGRLYARGASDDKGQICAHFKAIDACLVQARQLPLNVKVIVEGEEESGGTKFEAFVRDHTPLLSADAVVISDSALFDRGAPSICCGMRGLAYFEIEVRGAATDLHSGSFGGTVANPALALAQILAALEDGAGRITIPGFYDTVRPPAPADRAAIAQGAFDAPIVTRLEPPSSSANLAIPHWNGPGFAQRSTSTASSPALRGAAPRRSHRRWPRRR